MSRVLILNPADDVAIALDDVAVGDTPDGLHAPARAEIPTGHKIARHSVEEGGLVRRYGQVIGRARTPIAVGDHVHVHNLAMAEDGREAEVGVDAKPVTPLSGVIFKGIVRPDGQVGTRNYIGVLTSVNCSATVARRIADAFPDAALPAGVDGVVAFTHQGGCGGSALSSDVTLLQRTLAGYARHPNFHAILIVGLGCEANQIPAWLSNEGLEPGPRLRTLTIQEAGGTARAIEAGTAIVRDLVADAAGVQRQPVDASRLIVGLQCGGSDGWSGVTANPALGAAVDRLVAHGGSAMLSETPEIWGAEHLLLRRAASPEVADRLNARLDWWRAYADKHAMELNNNPSPGNLKGGLTTILEKSLGAVAKSGSVPLNDVIGYAERLRAPGLTFMDSPGYDPCSATGQIASGANLIVFTTGRGSVFGAKPAPSIKVASNARLAQWMDEDMDVDASPILNGVSIDTVAETIFQRMLAVASGEPSKSEALGIGDNEFVPWQVGAYL
ncbi:UxaA family hydrolase [Brevundimonas sp. PAMC22021]|uniref:UxaA family hydrolase n=1 Tax=Brevundimonas sp. PAMC22021 TaxID=2861285 RepID=UPI001C6344E4|nr:altronate dehydratase family protein [Brevundimonas sp. PAMC22021]QYF87726.1 altronate dehydratase family protein [Brevundimonas sp. PAMC22021]